MSLQSVKARFMGSYIFLVVLFVIQIPIIYVILGGMGQKYVQEDVAGSLRKRAVEITEILNRQITTGNEALEEVFQAKKQAYDGVIETLRTGSERVPAITDPEILAKLDTVETKWKDMRSVLDRAKEHGDNLAGRRSNVQGSTFPLVGRLNTMIGAIQATKDPGITKYINISGLQRMRTVKLSYLLERYFVSYEDKEAAAKEINKTISDFEATLAEISGVASAAAVKGATGRNLLAAVNDVEDLWKERKTNILEGILASDAYRLESLALADTHTPGVVKIADELTKMFISKAQASASRGVLIMVVAVCISTIIAAFFMWSANTMILRPLLRIKDTVEDFAKGTLTKRANIKVRVLGKEFNDEITSLGASVDEMADQMSDVIGKITDSSNHLASASEQLSTSCNQIQEGANRQSGQTGQVATAMEEMSATVIEVAKNSQQVSESAKNAQETAANGGDVVNQAIAAMQEVSESTSATAGTIGKLGASSEEIGTIVSVINDIADQTNLLALNAAIEAARAGEQGRGFAVVADEVRKLAERTTSATKEISSMISSIQTETSTAVESMDEGTHKVDNGVKLAHEAGDALGKIVAGVQSVTDMVSQIATSTEEQSATTDEISRNMDSISEVAQSNVQAIGEVSKATGEMARLAAELKELVSNFSITKEAGGPDLKVISGNQTSEEELSAAS